jgi:hypothetical protein
MIGDIEVTYAEGLTGKLRSIVLEEAQGIHLGDVFDYNMEQYISNFWRTGSEVNLPQVVKDRLQQLKNQGYELVMKPKVSISGKTPEPDMLFIKYDKVNRAFDFNDCIYIDNKYSVTSGFTGAQQQIINDFGFDPARPWAEVVGKGKAYKPNLEAINIDAIPLRIKQIQIIGIDMDLNLVIKQIKP